MIVVSRLGCRAGARWALEDVSLDVRPGEIVALAGPNGAGKSLLLAVCATLVRADAGTVRIDGLEVARAGAARARFGYLPETLGHYPQLTVREDLHLFARAGGLNWWAAAAACDRVLERWSLVAHAGTRTGSLGGGLLRRVGLARAMVHAPPALLLDGPSCFLDAEAHETLWRELRTHANAGGAVLLATHHPRDLARAHRVVTLDAGRVRDTGPAPGAPRRVLELVRP